MPWFVRTARAWLAAWALLLFPDCTSCARQPAKDTLAGEGHPCDLDEGCETGLCDVVPGTNDRVCLRKCTAGCREADQCTRLAPERYACVPQRAGLCQPCQRDADCPYPADKCITLGNDRFCGRDCSFDSTCPPSFRCADAIALDGTSVTKQCQPQSGTCACIAATAGQTMPCEVTNAFGTCLGTSTCAPPAGWSECNARTPVAELCNGRDDDCDGLTDEDIPDLLCGVGECERRAAACLNGRPGVCTPGMPEAELCNRKDDNCDGRVDEGFDLMNDVGHCGGCNRTCAFTNAVPKCAQGACAIDRCIAGWVDLDGVAANGCEHPCTPSNNGVEVCDGRDNNCDGRVDEGFDLAGDPMNCGQCGLVCTVTNGSVSSYRCNAGRCAVAQCAMGRGDCNQLFADGCEENLVSSLTHCGQCGLACAPANATGVCQMGNCRIGTCNIGFRDCNGMAADGCEIETNADVNNCGVCGRVCSAPNATSACTNGACTFTCLTNWYDVDNNAANGCEYACVRTNNGVEACDLIDNDCDGLIDEDFNLQSDPQHCGMCNRACIPPPFVIATACAGGQCGLTACVPGRGNCNGSYADGCEVDTTSSVAHCGQCGQACNAPFVATYTCTSGTCGIAACAAGRGNCNNTYLDGREADLNTSLAHCGGCGNACVIANGTPRCTAGSCQVQSCNGSFRDCNSSPSDGCETNTATSVSHCGGCGQACSRPFTTASCVNSTCQFVCLPGRFDLDGDPANGCEYGCTAMGSDLPDLGFQDADCDGIDGTASASIFVAKTGSDGNPGTRAAPKLTIAGGITAAQALGRTAVLISEGTYAETVTLVSGISLYGGYSAANNWARAATYVTVINSATTVGVTAQNLSAAAELQLLTIQSANAVGQEPNGDGRSSMAVLALNNTGALLVNGCTLRPGSGSAGAPGAMGTMGLSGNAGGVGNTPLQGSSGAAGTSPCGAPGAIGGAGVSGEANGNAGGTGTTAANGASGGNGGAGGTRGDCSTFAASNGGDAPPVTANGAEGSPGAHGFPGPALGTLLSGVYLPASGQSGATGQTGGGGGGGGSGGGTQRGSGAFCLGCSNLTSGGGGGGGGGGCGGTGGTGGRGGGGSFGVLAANAPVSVLASTIVTAAGGPGGAGGSGGPGGPGGAGGNGGAGQTYSGGCNSKRAGNGAQGASGGNGGRGGGGSGGSGGPSVCVAWRGIASSLSGGSCSTAPAAPGGPGGSNGATNAPPGSPGVSSNIISLP